MAMNGGEFLMWLHLCAMASYVGAQFAVIYMLIPAAETAPNENARRASLIAGFKFYNPFTIGVLGIIVISGAMRLTDLKASMKFDYFAQIGSALELKLGLAFVLIFIQTYITFGLAFRIGRQEEVAAHGDGEAFTVAQIHSMLRRIRAIAWLTIVLAAAVIWVSLPMVARAVDDPAAASRLSACATSSPASWALTHPVASAMLATRGMTKCASATSEPTRYATVMMPNSAPGISLSMLYCARRVAALTSVASSSEAIPASLASVVDAFISIPPVKFFGPVRPMPRAS